MKRSDKRGSHVGMVLSFIIFVVFLAFLYTILNPSVGTRKEQGLVIESLEVNLVNEISANLITAVIAPTGMNCMNVDDSQLSLPSGLMYQVVKDENGNIIQSRDIGSSIVIERNSQDILWIYYSSEEFEESITSVSGCSATDVESVRKEDYIFETKVFDLLNNYNLGYESVKDSLGVPIGNEFNFIFEFENGTKIGEEKNLSIEVYTKDLQVQYVDKEARILPGNLRINVW